MHVLTAEQAAAVDARTIHEVGIPGLVLMETAGRAVVRALQERWPRRSRRGVAVFCGPGNNGGDGFVIARALALRGVPVEVCLLGSPHRLQGDAAQTFHWLQEAGGEAVPLHVVERASDSDAIRRLCDRSAVLVDALFGTGLARPLTSPAADVVEILNRSGRPTLAVDIPSGVNGTSGHVLGAAVQADLTVTIGFLKRGLLLYPGAARCGAIRVAEIGFPQRLAEAEGDGVELPSPSDVAGWIPERPVQAHKGTSGRVLVVAGSTGMTGAAMLASRSALRTGSGVVVLALAKSLNAFVEPALWEALTLPLEDGGSGWLGREALDGVEEAARDARALALGPGVGRRPETVALVGAVLERVALPTVLDADGLLALPACRPAAGALVVTPHPGEMAQLLDRKVPDILADPVGTARECARRFGVVALLKGAHTVVAAPDGRVRINFSGNPGMASPGVGDVLTGVVASLLGQGAPPFEAAAAGAFLHGHAANRVAEARGMRGLLAGDIADALPAALNDVLARPAAIAFPRVV